MHCGHINDQRLTCRVSARKFIYDGVSSFQPLGEFDVIFLFIYVTLQPSLKRIDDISVSSPPAIDKLVIFFGRSSGAYCLTGPLNCGFAAWRFLIGHPVNIQELEPECTQ